MTAVPGEDRSTFTLVCDSCGHRLPDIESALKHWSVTWAVIRPTGRTGSCPAKRTAPLCTLYGRRVAEPGHRSNF